MENNIVTQLLLGVIIALISVVSTIAIMFAKTLSATTKDLKCQITRLNETVLNKFEVLQNNEYENVNKINKLEWQLENVMGRLSPFDKKEET